MKGKDFYSEAHLVVAAIRILEHQNSAPPSIDEVCRTISLSLEQGNFVCRKLNEMNIIDVVEGAFGTKLFIKNHLLLEEIPREQQKIILKKNSKNSRNLKKIIHKKLSSSSPNRKKREKTSLLNWKRN